MQKQKKTKEVKQQHGTAAAAGNNLAAPNNGWVYMSSFQFLALRMGSERECFSLLGQRY